MVLLDTNVVSDLMHVSPNPAVLAWIDNQPSRQLYVTAVTESELRTGIAYLPEGARRKGLLDAVERTLDELFADRVLPFDSSAARAFAEVAAARRAAGRPISQSDCQIAAIALARGMAVATRNVRDFSETGVNVIDPWAGA
ncbi:MAG: type II toxin-antitoxin system VapC family toxin [Nitrospinae bacterium]|nr:type II toxin-antitoxin system VapC family toxin [Nitrospinota bacterium]